MKIVTPRVELLAVTPNAEALIYTALRQCYSELYARDIFADNIEYFIKGTNIVEKKKLIQRVFESGHTSVAEHVNFTFAIDGVSRAFSHQGVRTRHSSISQQSQRYVTLENGEFGYILPKTIEESGMGADFIRHMEKTAKLYQRMIETDIPAEDARFVLPNATATAYVVTMNCVSLAHTLGLRLCSRAQHEYRNVANQMYKICKSIVPVIFDLVGPRCEVLGYCPEKDCCGRKITKEELFRRADAYKNDNHWSRMIQHEEDHEFGDE